VTLLAALACAIWLWLLLGHGGFWLARERDDTPLPAPAAWPSVTAVVPARDEADVIARSIGSLLRQDYPGAFRVVLVDDNSSDATAQVARSLAPDADRLAILPGAPLAPGWTGKLWAVHQGIAAAGTAEYLWLTDADIEHAPDTLASLVARAQADGRVLVSLMAHLRCDTPAERALIPAFVFFFQMLYPFGQVNRPGRTAGAAGGCMLVRQDALAAAGGIAAVRGALIDDCAVGALLKRQGPVWLGLTRRSRSIRPYGSFADVGAMIARSAYAQLGYSPLRLAGTVLGLALVYLIPPLAALLGHGAARWLGLAGWGLMAVSFQPTLRFYRRSRWWGLALPPIAAFYGGCTLQSALAYAQGRGGMWKGRAQALTKAA
jgi:hopene-associated glycosyltransferase HpnB